MDSKLSPTSPIRDGGIRKRMRKGTHSCFECRRRKIRCIFSPNNPRICTECFARGSQCIDQEHADPTIILDQRKNLRERVARLEDLVNSILDDKTDSKAAYTLTNFRSEATPPTPRSGDSLSPSSGAPMAWCSMNDKTSTHQTECSLDPMMSLYPVNHGSRKNEHVIHALKSLLPPPEQLSKVLDKNKTWWKSITTAMVGPGGTPKNLTDIHAYAEFALTVGTPMDVAKILHMVIGQGIFEDSLVEKVLATIDHLIINDDEYMGTLSGVEVAQQQARHVGDIGQSRKAWLIVRRAVSFAQLMGLNRTRVNVRQDLAFWGLYQFDRFCSLILGVPYSLADVHCNLTFRARSLPIVWESHHFLTHLAILAGKVIDRTHNSSTPLDSASEEDKSFESLVAIDQELVALKTKMPAEYWEVESVAPKEFFKTTGWMQRSLSLVMWNQTRLILHLPHLFKSSSVHLPNHNSDKDSGHNEFSRKICLEIARSILKLFRAIRRPENHFAYRTMAIDFLGVISSVVLVVDILMERNHALSISNNDPVSQERSPQEDWDLVQTTLDMLQQAENLPFSKLAIQGRRVLSQLIEFRDPQIDHSGPVKIMIPFFGTVTIYSGRIQENNVPSAGGKADVTAASLPVPNKSEPTSELPGQARSTFSKNNSTPAMMSSTYSHSMPQTSQSPSSTSSPLAPLLHGTGATKSNLSPIPQNSPAHFALPTQTASAGAAASVFEPQIAYDGVYMQCENNDFVTSGLQGISARIPSGHLPNGWQNVGTFDLDQDWGWLMGDTHGHGNGN